MLQRPLPNRAASIPKRTDRLIPVALLACFCAVAPAAADGTSPLRDIIDQHVSAGWKAKKVTPAGPSSDAEFLRRVTLDLTGTLPTSAEARAFLDDRGADKRARLVESLLASPAYARHMQHVFDVILLERHDARYVTVPEWQAYLRASFAANKPYDQLVREMLGADGKDPKTRPAMRFYLARNMSSAQALLHDKIVRDVGRLFLGVNLQCAQCHDHPHIADYKQADYHGLKAFIVGLHIDGGDANSKGVKTIGEQKPMPVKFTSVFDKKAGEKKTGPRLPGAAEMPETTTDRRGHLARLLPATDNVAFRRNASNRLWELLMGRGLVHPLDLHHSKNPPSHPELMTVLADRFAADGFNVREFLRELALSRTYQLSSVPPTPGTKFAPELFAVAPLRPLRPHVLAHALMQATGFTDAQRLGLGKGATEEAVHAKLAPYFESFVKLYGKAIGQPDTNLESSLFQALFLANGPVIPEWLGPRPGDLMTRLAKLPAPKDVAEELYLSIYSRRPDADEVGLVEANLKGANREEAIKEMIWAMLASAEFRFNH